MHVRTYKYVYNIITQSNPPTYIFVFFFHIKDMLYNNCDLLLLYYRTNKKATNIVCQKICVSSQKYKFKRISIITTTYLHIDGEQLGVLLTGIQQKISLMMMTSFFLQLHFSCCVFYTDLLFFSFFPTSYKQKNIHFLLFLLFEYNKVPKKTMKFNNKFNKIFVYLIAITYKYTIITPVTSIQLNYWRQYIFFSFFFYSSMMWRNL